MYAVITQVAGMDADKNISVVFDIHDGDEIASPGNSIRCRPSEVDGRIKGEINAFEIEEEKAIEINVGDVVTTDGAPA